MARVQDWGALRRTGIAKKVLWDDSTFGRLMAKTKFWSVGLRRQRAELETLKGYAFDPSDSNGDLHKKL